MYCKHLEAEMEPLHPGDEVEMAELNTGRGELFRFFFFFFTNKAIAAHLKPIMLVIFTVSCVSDPRF